MCDLHTIGIPHFVRLQGIQIAASWQIIVAPKSKGICNMQGDSLSPSLSLYIYICIYML